MTMKTAHLLATFTAAALFPNAGSAAIRVGEWGLEGGGSETCAISRHYPSTGATLFIALKGAEAVAIGASKPGWTAEAGKSYEMNVVLDSGVYQTTGKGTADTEGEGPGIGGGFPMRILKEIGSSKDIVLFLGETPLDIFSLAGSGKAVSALQECVAETMAAKRQADKRKALIPFDPFAPSAR